MEFTPHPGPPLPYPKNMEKLPFFFNPSLITTYIAHKKDSNWWILYYPIVHCSVGQCSVLFYSIVLYRAVWYIEVWLSLLECARVCHSVIECGRVC